MTGGAIHDKAVLLKWHLLDFWWRALLRVDDDEVQFSLV
jgi:hypothetical protein